MQAIHELGIESILCKPGEAYEGAGMFSVYTKALLAKVSGKSQMKPALRSVGSSPSR